MTSLDITIFYNIGSLVIGLGALIFACLAIISKKFHMSHGLSVSSFSLCAISLVFQFLEIGNRMNSGDFSAIADTIQAIIIASSFLAGLIVILNIVAFVKSINK